jgi:Protein of unknown function/Domain of unknown function (DUF1835)
VTASVCHVVFNPSAAAGLRDALMQASREERVVSLFDCLSFGPINPPDPTLRAEWVEKELGYTGWEEVVGKATSFWSEALSVNSRKIAWLSRRSTQEYAGFLEYLWRLGEEPIEVVDLTDVVVAQSTNGPTKRRFAISLALLPSRTIVENDLLNRAEILNSVLRARYLELWERLKAENAPLRVLSGGELVSAPLSFFDPLLLSCATPEWQKAARIVGEALSDFLTTAVLQTGDLVFSARVRALANAGRLESRGDLTDIHRSELRLPNDFLPANAD